MCSTTLCTAGCSTTLFTGFSKTLLTWRSHNLVDGVQHNFVHGGKKILLGKIVISYDLDCRAFNAFHGGYLPLLHASVTFFNADFVLFVFISMCCEYQFAEKLADFMEKQEIPDLKVLYETSL